MLIFLASLLLCFYPCLSLANPLSLRSPLELASNGTSRLAIVSLMLSRDKQSYFAVISLGGINFRVALDTASSDLWILSSECTTKQCRNLPAYPHSYQSPTYGTVGNGSVPFRASYADGTSVSGYVAKETIHFSNLSVPSFAFGMITNSNVTLTDEISGVLGLAFPRLSSIPTSIANATSFFGSLAQQGLLESPIFGLSLTNSSGTLSIGAIDSSVVTNESLISWNTVYDFPPFGAESNTSSYLQWALPLSGFSFDGTEIAPSPTYPNSTRNTSLALLDIGSSGIYGPYQDVSRLYARVAGARLVDLSGQWAIPCNTVAQLSFTFGTKIFVLQPTDYIIGATSGNPNLCLSWPRAAPPSADGIDWQLGIPFLETVYSIYSFGINRKESPLIGLYSLRNDIQETPGFVSSILSSASATVSTTLPNHLLPTPTPTIPPYQFNASVSHLSEGIASSGLATSTYAQLIGPDALLNTTALPTIRPPPIATTFVITDSAGFIVTSVSTYASPSVTLGVPPGWSGGSRTHPKFSMNVIPFVIIPFVLGFLAHHF